MKVLGIACKLGHTVTVKPEGWLSESNLLCEIIERLFEFSAQKLSTVDHCAQLMPTAMPTIMNPHNAMRPVLQD